MPISDIGYEVVFEFLGLHYIHIQSLEFLGFEFLGLHYVHMKLGFNLLGLNFLVIWFPEDILRTSSLSAQF